MLLAIEQMNFRLSHLSNKRILYFTAVLNPTTTICYENVVQEILHCFHVTNVLGTFTASAIFNGLKTIRKT